MRRKPKTKEPHVVRLGRRPVHITLGDGRMISLKSHPPKKNDNRFRAIVESDQPMDIKRGPSPE